MILLIYVLISFYIFFSDQKEKYPIFDWNLFSSVPGENNHFFIKVDQKILFGPEISNYLDIDYLPEYFFKVQEAGIHFETTGERVFLREIEGKFIKRPVLYKLVKVEYNPLELKRSGKIKNEEVLGEFWVE